MTSCGIMILEHYFFSQGVERRATLCIFFANEALTISQFSWYQYLSIPNTVPYNSFILVNMFTEQNRVSMSQPNWTRPTHVYSLCKRVDEVSFFKISRSKHHDVHYFIDSYRPTQEILEVASRVSTILIALVHVSYKYFTCSSWISIYQSNSEPKQFEGVPINNTQFVNKTVCFLV